MGLKKDFQPSLKEFIYLFLSTVLLYCTWAIEMKRSNSTLAEKKIVSGYAATTALKVSCDRDRSLVFVRNGAKCPISRVRLVT